MFRSPFVPRAAGKAKPTFSTFKGTGYSGIANLEASLTINSSTETPVFRYKGGDASESGLDAWTYGSNLSFVNNGNNADYNNGSPLMGTNDDSVRFNKGDYFEGSASDGDITTEDFVIEMVFRTTDVALGTTDELLSKTLSDTNGGWAVKQATNDKLVIVVDDGTTTSALNNNALDKNTWYHLMLFFDRSGFLGIYLNGVADGAISISGSSGSATSASKLTLGAQPGGAQPSNTAIAYCAMWKKDSWLDTHAQAGIAKERFSRLSGLYANKAKGTAVQNQNTRATTAYLDKEESGVRKLYQVSSSWIRIVRRPDSNNECIEGALIENAATNTMFQSEDMSTTWAKALAGDTIDSNSVEAPNQLTTADGIIANASDTQHGFTQSATVTASTWTYSVFAKKGDKDWLYLANDTVAGATAYFNISTGALGTAGAGVTESFIESWGNGWYRCGFSFTGTVASHDFQLYSANADTDNDFSGDGATTNTYFWGVQLENNGYMSSYIPTTTSTVTRNKDELAYKGDDGNLANTGVGAVSLKGLMPNYDSTAGFLFTLSDGGSSLDRIYLQNTTGDALFTQVLSSGGDTGSVSGSSDLSTGVITRVRVTWKTDSHKLFVNGTEEGTEDTGVDPPNDIDQIEIGMAQNNISQLDGIISDFKIYDTVKGK